MESIRPRSSRRFLFAISLAGATGAAGCVPDQRPDVSFSVRTCAGQASGGTVKHNACLVFDGSESHSFGGRASYSWTAEIRTGIDAAGNGVYAAFPAFAARAENAAVTAGRVWFENVLDPDSDARVTLTVTDEHGLRRSSTRELVLTNTRPAITQGATYLRPRSTDLYLVPFVVAHLPITEPDDDDLALSVTQVSPPPGPGTALQSIRCSDIPKHFQGRNMFSGAMVPLPDFGGGDRNAWCFSAIPQDDAQTPGVDESGCGPGSPCFAVPAIANDPVDYVFRVKVLEENEADPAPDTTACSPAVSSTSGLPIETVACVTVRVDDVLWTASSSPLEGGQLSRVARGWRRTQPTTVAPRNGAAIAQDSTGRVWLAGTLKLCYLFDYCPGGMVGVSPALDTIEVIGLGQIHDLQFTASGPGGSPGLWVGAVSLGASGNPGGGSVAVAAGTFYYVFVPYGAAGGSVDLATLPASNFTWVTGFDHSAGGDPRTLEYGYTSIPQPDGSLWISSIEWCAAYDRATSTCVSANPTAPYSGMAFHRVRRIPAASLTVGSVSTITGATPVLPIGAGALQPPPAFGLQFDAIAADGANGAFIANVVNANGYGTVISHFDATGTFDRDVPYSGTAVGLAYDASADALWVADVFRASIDRLGTPLGATIVASHVPGLFTLPLKMTVDAGGDLWVDDHPNDFTRRMAWVPSDAASATFFDPYASTGRGIAPGLAQEQGAWHPDVLDAVRQPTANPVEVPATIVGPIGATLAGVDPLDGAAYAYTPDVAGDVNVFRVSVDGTFAPLLALTDFPPTCAAVAPDLPSFVVGTSEVLTSGSLWLCMPDLPDKSAFHLARIGLDRLRAAARDAVPPPALLRPCPADAAPNLVCEDDTIPIAALDGTPVIPTQIAFSLGEFHLYVLGATYPTPVPALLSVRDSRYFPQTGDPPAIDGEIALVGPLLPSTTATQPLAPALVFNVGSGPSDVGGVWVILADDTVRRFRLPNLNQAPPVALIEDPGYLIPPLSAAFHPNSVATDALNVSVWTTADMSGSTPQAAIARTAVLNSNGTINLFACGSALVPTHGQALAVHSYTSSAWTSGKEEVLVRVRSRSGCNLETEYVRHPDIAGSSATTPGGQSLSTGGL